MKKITTYHNNLNEIEFDLEQPPTTCREKMCVCKNSCFGFIFLFCCVPCYFLYD